MSLNPWQVNLFRQAGFMRLPQPLPEKMVAGLKKAIWESIEEEREPLGRGEDGSIVRVSNVLEREPIFWEAATSPLVLDPLAGILGPNIEMLRNRHNHATLVTGASRRGAYFHRDCLTWTRNIVTVIFLLEESTALKGCTRVVPGSHTLPWADIVSNHPEEPNLVGWDLLGQEVLVEMPAGGMLAIDSQILHAQGVNRTDETRMSMTLGYSAVDELASMEEPERFLVRGQRLRQGSSYSRGPGAERIRQA